jgi:hypothetical protein
MFPGGFSDFVDMISRRFDGKLVFAEFSRFVMRNKSPSKVNNEAWKKISKAFF